MKFFKFSIILEVLSQEIPAKMQKTAANQLFLNFLKSARGFLIFPSPKKFQKINYFDDKDTNEFFEQIKREIDLDSSTNSLENFDVKTYFSSSRIAFKAEFLIFQKTEEKIIKGPPKSSKELAIEKFLERSGASKDELQTIHEKGVEYYALIKKIHFNSEVEQILGNLSSSCLSALKEFKWPNSLFYEGSNGDSWIRPIKNILAVCEGPDKIVKKLYFEYAGIFSSNSSFGHKFLSVKNFHEFEPQKIEISRIADYTSLLKQNFVLISPEERMNHLINSAKEKAPEFRNYLIIGEKNEFKQSALHIKELFDELICIADWPNVLICEIQDQFMSLPSELIEYVMISHQRYCPLILENGKLSRKFIVVIDQKGESAEMKAGYEKVLFARLLDAKFFFERFLKADVADIMNEKLKMKESEFSDLSVFDLNSKIFEISEKLLKSNTKIALDKKILDASRIDLCFELISEYPALRGLMGKYFWENQSKEKIDEIFECCEKSRGDVLEKIESIGKNLYFNGGEVYKRENLDSEALEARLFGISEKIIRLQYFFFEKKQSPTGSKDPFALKRDTNNLFEMILKDSLNDEFKKELFDFDLYELILSHEKKNSENSLLILNFLYKNLEQYLLLFFSKCDLDFSKKIIGFLINELSCWKHSWVKDLFENKRLNSLKIMQISSYFIDLKSKINSDFKESFKRLSGIYLKKYALFKIDLDDGFEFYLKEELEIRRLCDEIENKTKEISCSKLYIEKILEYSLQISESINSFLDNIFIEDEDQKKKMRRIFLIKKLFELIELKFPFHKFFEFF